jgi:hypothetical protein
LPWVDLPNGCFCSASQAQNPKIYPIKINYLKTEYPAAPTAGGLNVVFFEVFLEDEISFKKA